MATAAQVIKKARSQKGKTEIGYTNKVIYNDEFYGGRSHYGSWAAWCAVFVWWIFKECGAASLVPRTAGVAVFFRTGNLSAFGMKKISKYNLRPGDLVRHTYSHIGLVTGHPKSGRVTTIAGNTSRGSGGSQRDGGGVWEKSVPLSQIQYGFRPKYGNPATKKSTTSKAPAKKPGKLVVDGAFGKDTIKALQRALKVGVDGGFGPNTKKALQRKLKVSADGIIGKRTVRALQRKVGTKVDGGWGKNTTKALQKKLNAGKF